MTFESFESVFKGKTPENIKTICTTLLKFAVSYKEVWITVGICALIGVLIHFTRKELGKDFRKIAVFSLILYVTYMIGMLGMYLFSMPVGEYGKLAGVGRYTKTILIAILYLNMVPAVVMISDLPEKQMKTVFTTACVFVSFLIGMFISSGSIAAVVINKTDNGESSSTAERKWIEDAGKKYNVPMESSYCILIPSEDSGYAYHLGKYIFQTSVKVRIIQSEDDFNQVSQKYVFVYDQDNEIIQDWIQKVYPEQVGNEVIIQPVANNQ